MAKKLKFQNAKKVEGNYVSHMQGKGFLLRRMVALRAHAPQQYQNHSGREMLHNLMWWADVDASCNPGSRTFVPCVDRNWSFSCRFLQGSYRNLHADVCHNFHLSNVLLVFFLQLWCVEILSYLIFNLLSWLVYMIQERYNMIRCDIMIRYNMIQYNMIR